MLFYFIFVDIQRFLNKMKQEEITEVKVWIKCKKTIHFDQQVNMSILDYNILKNNDSPVSEANNPEAYNLLDKYITYDDIYDDDKVFTDFELLTDEND